MEAPTSQPNQPEHGSGAADIPAHEAEQPASESSSFELTDDAYSALGFVEHEGEKYAMFDEDEQIAYKGLDDLRDAVRTQQSDIIRNDQEVSNLQRKLEGATQGLQAREQDLSLLESRVTEDDLIAPYLLEELGEELATKDLEELTDKERSQRENALINAKARLVRDREKLAEQQEIQQQKATERMEAATDFYNRSVTAETFGVQNPEQQEAVVEFLTHPTNVKDPEGKPINRAQLVYNLASEIGEDVAGFALEGLKEKFWNEHGGTPAPTSEQSAQTQQERVYEPGETAESATQETEGNVTARDRMAAGLKANKVRSFGSFAPVPKVKAPSKPKSSDVQRYLDSLKSDRERAEAGLPINNPNFR